MTKLRPKARRQLALDFEARRWGGRRKGAGRKPRAERKGFVAHTPRPEHHEQHPQHVSVRCRAAAPDLRTQRAFAAIRAVLARSSEKGFRLLHFSIMHDHLHLMVEADSGLALSRGLQRLLSRVAMAVNAVARRRGSLFRDRYHRQDLRTPTQVRNALVYVLFNHRKHLAAAAPVWPGYLTDLDPFSSAAWFRDWRANAAPGSHVLAGAGPPIVATPRSWLAHTGWRRRGLISLHEAPRPPVPRGR